MNSISEGLRANDLRGMVQNIVSVDEYVSKIDERAIVIGFYVADLKAAEDLNRFIQKSFVELLDTEVSAAPDQKGNYMVFVEMPMNDKTAKAVADLCNDIGSLATIHKWEVNVRDVAPSEPLDPSGVEQAIRSTLHFTLDEFFSRSDLNKITLVESFWLASSDTAQMTFNVADYGSFDQVVQRNKITESAVDLSSDSLRTCKSIRSILGNAWCVDKVGHHFAVYRDDDESLLLLSHKPL